jgi:hemerythrin superfamily protein
MADVFEVLRRDHDEVRAKLARLESGPGSASGASEAELRLRKKLTDELIMEESRHEAAEEEYFWPVVRERLAEGQRLADQAAVQEQQGKRVLHQLGKLDPTEAEFDALLIQFVRDGRAHMVFEETQVWRPLGQILSEQEADGLGAAIEQAKPVAPTRPHPHMPAAPAVLKTAGPAIAAADMVRDILTGRGEH